MAWIAAGAFLASTAGAQEGPSSGYRIGPRDRLEIQVAELPELDTTREVGEDGTLQLPVIGAVQAKGFTEEELALRIKAQLEAQYVRRATVAVRVAEYRARPVSVLGAVGSPGTLPIPGRAPLLEVLLKAGGLTKDHGELIYVRRRAPNGLTDQVEIAVDDLITKGDPKVNIPILAGDFINIPAARQVTIHFLGEVGHAGSQTFLSTQRVTLLRAISAAGGLTETAARKLRILRRDAAGEQREIVADYRRILAGKAPDVELEDGDIIVVKESFF